MGRKPPDSRVLEDWTERDLTAAAQAGALAPAFEMDDPVGLASDVLESGRNLVVAGESGVGRTALVYELVRRAAAGIGPSRMSGRRVLQFSLRHRAAGLKDPRLLLPEMQRLVEVLCRPGSDVIPFFRDIHLAYTFDLEPQFQALGYRHPGPIIGEGDPAALAALFEAFPELEQHYLVLSVDEPTLTRTAAILERWAADLENRARVRFDAEALEEALHLSHRFLSRGRFPRKALDLLSRAAAFHGTGAVVGRNEVVQHFSKTHHVPRALIDPGEPLDLEALHHQLGQALLGQGEAVKALARIITLIKSGLSDMRRPFGVFLFAGPTGVGKTHAAQLLAQHLFGSRERLVRINMADYQAESSPDLLFGDASDYRLPARRGLLTQRLAGHPFAVLLLDEFEKAHDKVADRFLQLFDEGAFINGNSETIACRSMILIATSNVGAEVYRESPVGFFSAQDPDRFAHELERRLQRRFRLELLNRFDQVVHFQPLRRADVRAIAARELDSLKDRIGFKRSGLDLEVDESVLDWLAAHGYDPRFGARFLRRTLEREVTSALAGVLVRGAPARGGGAYLTVRNHRVVAGVTPPGPVRSRREAVMLPLGTTTEKRSMDVEALEAKAAELLAVAGSRFAALESKRHAASELLAAMNEPGFWDAMPDNRETLERYRDLDVGIQVEERLAGVFETLQRTLDDRNVIRRDPKRLARAVEAAAAALRRWDDGATDAGARAVWLLIERADPTQRTHDWLEELTRIELAWCRRLHLESSIAAFEMSEPGLVRVILQVEGPGAETLLAMERGIHRRARPAGTDMKARIHVVPRDIGQGRPRPRVAAVKPRSGPLQSRAVCTGALDVPAKGILVDVMGVDPDTLPDLLADAAAHLERDSDERSIVARVYDKDGVGARDPRTGATVLRLKQVAKGELDPLLEAWRLRSAPAIETV